MSRRKGWYTHWLWGEVNEEYMAIPDWKDWLILVVIALCVGFYTASASWPK